MFNHEVSPKKPGKIEIDREENLFQLFLAQTFLKGFFSVGFSRLLTFSKAAVPIIDQKVISALQLNDAQQSMLEQLSAYEGITDQNVDMVLNGANIADYIRANRTSLNVLRFVASFQSKVEPYMHTFAMMMWDLLKAQPISATFSGAGKEESGEAVDAQMVTFAFVPSEETLAENLVFSTTAQHILISGAKDVTPPPLVTAEFTNHPGKGSTRYAIPYRFLGIRDILDFKKIRLYGANWNQVRSNQVLHP